MSAKPVPEITSGTRMPLGWVVALMGGVVTLTAGLFTIAISSFDRVDLKYLSQIEAAAKFTSVEKSIDVSAANTRVEIAGVRVDVAQVRGEIQGIQAELRLLRDAVAAKK